MTRRSLRHPLVDLTISQAAPLLGGFLVTFGSAAALGPTGRGELAFVTSTSTVAATSPTNQPATTRPTLFVRMAAGSPSTR